MSLTGLNDWREYYFDGTLTIQRKDEHGFILHSIDVPRSELIDIVGDSIKVEYFHYDGKTEMSTEIYSSIKGFDVTSSIRKDVGNPFKLY